MFIEMFGASALAVVLFSKEQNNYTSEFSKLTSELNKANNKLDEIRATQIFMHARSCLTEFSPKLLNNIQLTYEHYTIQDIMQAAKEGFDLLLNAACADENNFLQARKIFNDTYGNEEWVNAQFGEQIDEITEEIAESERRYKETQPQREQLLANIKTDIVKLITNTPCKKHWFYTELNVEQTREQIKAISANLQKYCVLTSNTTEILDLQVCLNMLDKQKLLDEQAFHDDDEADARNTYLLLSDLACYVQDNCEIKTTDAFNICDYLHAMALRTYYSDFAAGRVLQLIRKIKKYK